MAIFYQMAEFWMFLTLLYASSRFPAVKLKEKFKIEFFII